MTKKTNLARFLLISGPSGAGKSTLVRLLLEDKDIPCQRVQRITTRTLDISSKTDCESYEYVSEERFIEMVNGHELVEHAHYPAGYYGTSITTLLNSKDSYYVIRILDLDPGAALKIRDFLRLSNMYFWDVFISPISLHTYFQPEGQIELMNQVRKRLLKRQRSSEYNDDVLLAERAQDAIRKMKTIREFSHVLTNLDDELDQTFIELKSLLMAENGIGDSNG